MNKALRAQRRGSAELASQASGALAETLGRGVVLKGNVGMRVPGSGYSLYRECGYSGMEAST